MSLSLKQKLNFSHKNQLLRSRRGIWSYATEELSNLVTWKREKKLHSCENIENLRSRIPQVRSSKNSLSNTLQKERSNWISTFYSGVDTNAFISSPIIFSSKFPSLISSTRRLDVIFSSLLLTHTSSQLLHPYHLYSTVYPLCPTSNTRTSLLSIPTHIPPFLFYKKLSPPSFRINSFKITPLRAHSKIFSKKPQLAPGWL